MVASDHPLTYVPMGCVRAPVTPVAGTTDTQAPLTPGPTAFAGTPEHACGIESSSPKNIARSGVQ